VSKKEKKEQPVPEEELERGQEQESPTTEEAKEPEKPAGQAEPARQTEPAGEPREEAEKGPDAGELKEKLVQQEDKYLRLFAEFDNYRKRTSKEKQAAWADAKAETAAAFLPVYDNLERALKQDTADEAYKKGVEMTMNQFKEVLAKLGVTPIEALGQPFDPQIHSAVMHVEDENAEENTVVEVFQQGFRSGEKVIRFAMVKVAN